MASQQSSVAAFLTAASPGVVAGDIFLFCRQHDHVSYANQLKPVLDGPISQCSVVLEALTL